MLAPVADQHRVTINYRAIDDLKLDPKNPRLHSPRQVRQIARSIEAFGFNVPVLVNSDLKVVAGHGRILACQLLGWREVPVIALEHLTEAQARAFMIADNRLTENSCWNDQLLAEQLKELSVLDLDFSLEATGFEMGEIDLRIEGLTSEAEAKDDPADVIPVATAPAVSRAGDLWLLGPHRVLCGSALEEDSYARLMGKKKAGTVFTDPPYNVPIEGNVSGFGVVHHREFAMASGEMSADEFTAFLTSACALLAKHSVPGAILFLCMDWRHLAELHAAGRAIHLDLKNLCVWAKQTAGMGALYRSQHELIFVYKSGRERHSNNVQLGRFGRNRTNLLVLPGCSRTARQRGRKSDRAARDSETGRYGCRRDHGRVGARRYRARCLPGQRHHADRRRAHRSPLLWNGDRSGLPRCCDSALAELDARSRTTCRHCSKFR